MTGFAGPPARLTVATPSEMHELGLELAAVLGPGDLVVLSGPLGAGKTTLTRGIGEGLGVRGPVTSPTFVLARTHPSLTGGAPLVHVDAYRLASALELDDLDIDYANSVVVVEWGAGMLDGVAESWLEVVIERPTGADASRGAGGRVPATAGTDVVGADDDGADVVGADDDALDDELDADELDAAELDAAEPRAVAITGFGPRWSGDAPGGGAAPGTADPA